MLLNADLEHAGHFHNLGRQLSALKRLYEGYELLIERLLDGQKHHIETTSRNGELWFQRAESTLTKKPDVDNKFGPTIPPATRLRFERLRDWIRLYALNEIQDCLDQKESLVKMVFVYSTDWLRS